MLHAMRSLNDVGKLLNLSPQTLRAAARAAARACKPPCSAKTARSIANRLKITGKGGVAQPLKSDIANVQNGTTHSIGFATVI